MNKNSKIGQKFTCKHCGREKIADTWSQVFCNGECSVAFMANLHSTNKETVQKAKKNGCEICGYNKWKSCLEFHHVYPENKLYEISRMGSHPTERIKQELAKCILLCCNCHQEIHRGCPKTMKRAVEIMDKKMQASDVCSKLTSK